jgi:hypothetical protein
LIVVLAGPMVSVAGAVALLAVSRSGLSRSGQAFVYASMVWGAYQLSPYPALDGGQAIRAIFASRSKSATLLWRLQWLAGLLTSISIAYLFPSFLEEVVLLSGLALILGRAESGYVRHLDAYAAWERGDHKAVIELVRRLPDYLDRGDKMMLLELGLRSAMELEDEQAAEELGELLPPHRPAVLKAAEWLLSRNSSIGAKLAQRALDALDAETVKPTPDELERFADATFRYAVFEAGQLNHESAIGLIERAIAFGFRDLDRIEADSALKPLARNPRYEGVIARLRD